MILRPLRDLGLLCAALCALVAVGCGSDNGGASDKPAAEKPRRGFEQGSSSGGFTRNFQVSADYLGKGESIKLTFDDQLELGDVDFDDASGHVDQHTLTIRGTGDDNQGPSASVSVARESGSINGSAKIPTDAGKVSVYVTDTYEGEIKNGDFSVDTP